MAERSLAMRKGDELQGKVALVTGGSRNIGRGIARALAAAGAAVMVNASRSETEALETVALIETDGGSAGHFMADVTDPAAVELLVEATVGRFGRLDILSINQTLRASTKIEDMSYDEFRRVVAVSLDGAFLCVKAALPHLFAAGSGSIVMMGGQSGVTGLARGAHIAAGKSALAGFAKALAHELAPRRITVNCVHPYVIDTARVAPGDHTREGQSTPIGRFGTVEEVAAFVRLLCGPDGSYITGQNIFLNGGAFMP